MAPLRDLALALLLLGMGAAADATPVWCFARLDEAGEGGACAEPLGDDPVPLADCCLNPAYGYKLRPRGHCHTCRPGAWGPWGPWGGCSVTCGEGAQRRGRSRGPEGGGERRGWELRACHGPCCPEEGSWSPWGPWGGCSVTCGAGSQARERPCDRPPPRCGGGCGGGAPRETRSCQGREPKCPVHGAWGPWGPWGACGGSCRGAGLGPTRSRRRLCDAPPPSTEPPGKPCEGAGAENQPCPGLPPCPVDGAWGAWSPAAPCAVTCGLGVVTLRRACDAPPPQHGGRGCQGNDTRRAACGPRGACPAVAHWGPWAPWSPCERPALSLLRCEPDVGYQKRTRTCVGREQGGAPCPTEPGGGTIQMRACYNVHNCLLQGNWSDWSPWGLCHPPCGDSPTRSRVRECQPIYPAYPLSVPTVRSATPVNVTFWGTPRPRCAQLEGQALRLEESRPCLNVPPCPPEHED